MKRLTAVLLACYLCLSAAANAADYEVPNAVYRFYLACVGYDVPFHAGKDPKIILNDNYSECDFTADDFRFVYMGYPEQEFVIMAFSPEYEMWAAVAAFQVFGGLTEREAFMAYYDLVFADRSATTTNLAVGSMIIAAETLGAGNHAITFSISHD